jgi:hypothetical protein
MLLPVLSLLLNTGGGVTISKQPTRLIGAEYTHFFYSFSRSKKPSITFVKPEFIHSHAGAGRGSAHASAVALVYRSEVRSGDSALLHILECIRAVV